MNDILEQINQFSDDQYSNQARLNARIQIYDYCEKDINWREWVFDHLDFTGVDRVLDIGCGNGIMWKENISKVPEDLHIVMTDISEGMVDSARKALEKYNRQFEFHVADACQLPFESNSFQMIIANRMLYHIENKKRVFSEIDRLLTDNGFAYASTLSTGNIQELVDIVSEYDNRLIFNNTQTIRTFSLENGEDILSRHFNVTDSYIYQNDIIIRESVPLILYMASCYSTEQIEILKREFNGLLRHIGAVLENTGRIRITNKNVLFKFGKKS